MFQHDLADPTGFIRDMKEEPVNKHTKFHLHTLYQTAVTIILK